MRKFGVENLCVALRRIFFHHFHKNLCTQKGVSEAEEVGCIELHSKFGGNERIVICAANLPLSHGRAAVSVLTTITTDQMTKRTEGRVRPPLAARYQPQRRRVHYSKFECLVLIHQI